MMTLNLLLQGVADNIKELKIEKTTAKDHSAVNSFQTNLWNWLNSKDKSHNWKQEYKDHARKENDSIDIYGKPKRNNEECEWIIEIDATRADQVAKKMLSRFALWGRSKNKPITYVALLYPDTQEGRNQSKKFISYGYELIHVINKNSKVYGIIIGNDVKKRDKNNSTAKYIVDEDIIEVFDPSENVHCNITFGNQQKTNVKGMGECAKEAILMYIEKHHQIKYDELKASFDYFIKDKKGKSLYKNTNIKLENKEIYTYTQFRHYGNWQKFIKLCKKKNISIKELVCCYTNKDPCCFSENLKQYTNP